MDLLIPARESSVRLKRKHLQLLDDLPLLAHVIRAALDSREFRGVMVSSSDKDTLSLAFNEGAATIGRPPALSEPDVTVAQVILQAVEKYEWPEVAVMLPTAALIRAEDIRGAMNHWGLYRHMADALMTVVRPMEDPRYILCPRINEDGTRSVLWRTIKAPMPEGIMVDAGALYVVKVEALKKYGDFYTPKLLTYELPRSRVVDANVQEDLEIMRRLAK